MSDDKPAQDVCVAILFFSDDYCKVMLFSSEDRAKRETAGDLEHGYYWAYFTGAIDGPPAYED